MTEIDILPLHGSASRLTRPEGQGKAPGDVETLEEPNNRLSTTCGRRQNGASVLQLNPNGDSGRRGIHPWQLICINFKSASRAGLLCNFLWPFVPAALAVRCQSNDLNQDHLEPYSKLLIRYDGGSPHSRVHPRLLGHDTMCQPRWVCRTGARS